MVSPTRTVTTLAILAIFLLSGLPATTADPSPLGDDDDAGSGTDAGDHRADALPIGPGAYDGRVTAGTDPADWYAFNVTSGQGVALDVDRAFLSSVSFSLYDADGNYQYIDSYHRTRILAETDGTWHLNARSGLHGGAYGFELDLVDLPPQDDAGSGRDATYWDPVALPDGNATATVNAFDDRDVFELEVVGTQTIRVDLTTDMPDRVWLVIGTGQCCDSTYDYGHDELSVELTATDTVLRVDVTIFDFFDADVVGGDYTLELTRVDVDTLELPDLVVTKIVEHRSPIKTDFTDDQPNNVNERRTIEVEITNEGDGDADAFVAGFVASRGDRLDWEPYFFDQREYLRDGLAAGETATVYFTWDTTLSVGDYTLIAGADIFYEVSEDDEENNLGRASTYVRVGGVI